MARHAVALAAALAVVLLGTAAARAQPWMVRAEFDFGTAGTAGAVGAELDAGFLYHLGVSGELHRLSLAVHGGFGLLASHQPERDDTAPVLWETGLALGYRLPLSARLHLVPRLGYLKDWINGSASVTRLCADTDRCDGGFYRETPRYHSTGPSLALRLEWTTPPGSDLIAAVTAMLSYQRLSIDLPGLGPTRGGLVLATFGCAFGGGGGAGPAELAVDDPW